MDLDNFNCIICLSLCEDAMESSCCGCLFCAKCTIGIYKECPSCRKQPLETFIVRSVRRAIGQVDTECPECKAKVKMSNMKCHKETCPATAHKIVANDCDYQGGETDMLDHLMNIHRRDILKLCMQPKNYALKNDDGHFVHVSKYNYRFYCGSTLPKPCACKFTYGIFGKPNPENIIFGCHTNNKCGPEAGENCPSCMKLDLRIRGLEGRNIVFR